MNTTEGATPSARLEPSHLNSPLIRTAVLLWILTALAYGRPLQVAGADLPRSGATSRPHIVLQVAGDVSDVFFSPDGRTLAAFDSNHGITLWDIRTRSVRREIYDPEIRRKPVFSSDGKLLITVDSSDEAVLREVASGKVRRIYQQFCGANDTRIAVYDDRAIRLHDIKTGKLLASIPQQRGRVYFSPDNKRVAVVGQVEGDSRVAVTIWNTAPVRRLSVSGGAGGRKSLTGAELQRLDVYGGSPVLFSPDGRSFATGGIDPDWKVPEGQFGDGGYRTQYVPKIWDVRSGRLVRVLRQGRPASSFPPALWDGNDVLSIAEVGCGALARENL